MLPLDEIQINFNTEQVALLNICLGFLMFGVALDLKIDDFKYIGSHFRSVWVGLVSQWLLLPILTMGLIWILQPEVSLALGMLLIAACPGGNVSNYAVHLAKANAALSVVLTMVSTLFCVLFTPIIFGQLVHLLPAQTDLPLDFVISFSAMAITIFQLIIVPLALGLLLSTYLPGWVAKIKSTIKKLSMLIFIGFVIAAVLGNLDNLKQYVGIVFFIVLLHNGLALWIGYFWSKKIMKLPTSDARAIAIETGIQNSGLALILIFNFFNGLGGMALIAAWWSIWHLLSSMSLAMWWGREDR